jgi:hypothetical protein
MDRYGTTLSLRGREYTIAPLTRRQLEKLWPKIRAIQQTMNEVRERPDDLDLPAVMDDVCEIVLAGLQGGGLPDMTLETVETQIIDISNYMEAWTACLRVSNIRLVPVDAGKVQALAQASPPTGARSTGT